MAININVSVARSVPRINDKSKTLVIFRYARQIVDDSPEASSEPIEITSLQELYDNFGGLTEPAEPASLTEEKELYVAEYLIRAGVNLLCYAQDTPGADIAAVDITNIGDIENLDYKMILVPYAFVDDDTTYFDELLDFVKDNDVQLFLDLEPFIEDVAADAAIGAMQSQLSSKVEMCINSGIPSFASNYELIPTDFKITDEGAYDEAEDFVGVPASAALVARKAALLNSDKPWLPVAGEEYGIVGEFVKLFRKIKKVEKENFQATNVNVLLTKIGIGNIFVSQNTMYGVPETDAEARNPLLRSHVVTEVLWIKRALSRISEATKFAPNIPKTWNMFDLSVSSMLDRLLEMDGIEAYSVDIGRGITMTEEDIANGLIKATIKILPVRVVEGITIDLVIQEQSDSFDILISGGAL